MSWQCGVKMGKTLKAKKALKAWLKAKDLRDAKRRIEMEENKEKYPSIWRKLKV